MTKEENADLSRREFLTYGVSSVVLLTHGLNVSPKVGWADGKRERSLALIYLRGGNDGFNTVVPYTDEDYYSSRPNIALHGNELIKLDERYALNSALHELAELYHEGVVAVFPKVGCSADLTKSHMRASRSWETASPDEQLKSTWYERMRPATTSISKVVIDGFDTHVDQRDQHFDSLRQLSTSIEKLRSELDNMLVFVYSEFGRSLKENSTLGTDHGSTGVCFAVGSSVKGGIYNGNTQVSNAGLSTDLDFRSIYQAIASDWFKLSWSASETLPSVGFLTT